MWHKQANAMEDILYSLRYAIPSVVVFLTAYYMLKTFFQQESKRRHLDLVAERMHISLPLRLQSYERLILLLELISPNNLIMRVHRPGMTARELQKKLSQSIREEYAHNLSQQLYVSPQAWKLITRAYEEMISQVNAIGASVGENETATGFSEKLLGMDLEQSATREAMDFLKSEARKNF